MKYMAQKEIPVTWTNPPGSPDKKNPSDLYDMVQRFITKMAHKLPLQQVFISFKNARNRAGFAKNVTATLRLWLQNGKELIAKAQNKKPGKALHDAMKKLVDEDDKKLKKQDKYK